MSSGGWLGAVTLPLVVNVEDAVAGLFFVGRSWAQPKNAPKRPSSVGHAYAALGACDVAGFDADGLAFAINFGVLAVGVLTAGEEATILTEAIDETDFVASAFLSRRLGM